MGFWTLKIIPGTADEPAAHLEETLAAEALYRLRLAILVLAWMQLPFIAADFDLAPTIAPKVLPYHIIHIAILVAGWFLTYSDRFHNHWRIGTSAFFAVLIAVGTVTSIRNPVPDIHLVALGVEALVGAIFLPWGIGWQALLNLMCLVGYAVHPDAFSGPLTVAAYRWFGLLTILGLSEICTSLFECYRDDTWRQVIEIAAREDKFRKVFDSSFDGIAISALGGGHFLDCNREFLAMTGFSREEVSRRSVADLFVDRQRLTAMLNELKVGREVHRQEISVRGRGDRMLSALVSLAPTELAGQSCVLTFMHDVTELRRADELLGLSRFSTEHAADIILWIGEQGRLVYANQAACEALGYSAEDLGELTIGAICPLPEETWVRVPQEGKVTFEAVLRARDGRELPVEVTANHIVFGGEVRVCAFARDLTALNLVRQAEELARSNVDLEQFAAAASHDLQEPLRIISSYLDLVSRRYGGRLDAEGNQYIHYATEAAARLRRLTDDLLAYARVDALTANQRVDCAQVLRSALDNLRLMVEESGAMVSHDAMPQVTADPSLLLQLLQNLLNNAIKFRGSQPPQIHISAKPHDGGWLFSMRDNGIGIDPQDRERIFGVFQRLHTRSQYPGSGVGLATCRRIVERYGGRIWVESELGQGATFFFTLPALPAASEQQSVAK